MQVKRYFTTISIFKWFKMNERFKMKMKMNEKLKKVIRNIFTVVCHVQWRSSGTTSITLAFSRIENNSPICLVPKRAQRVAKKRRRTRRKAEKGQKRVGSKSAKLDSSMCRATIWSFFRVTNEGGCKNRASPNYASNQRWWPRQKFQQKKTFKHLPAFGSE